MDDRVIDRGIGMDAKRRGNEPRPARAPLRRKTHATTPPAPFLGAAKRRQKSNPVFC